MASKALPGSLRRDLRAVYDVARTIDEIGDAEDGRSLSDRLLALDAFELDLDSIWADSAVPHHPVLGALAPTVDRHGLPAEPFKRLIEANRIDQRQTTCATWDVLRDYCSYSADPIGRIVLGIFGAATPQRVAWSDEVCTALQVVEHCQDVAEDQRRGRIYLPLETLEQFGVCPADVAADVAAGRADAALRRAVRQETERARDLLCDSGPALLATLRGTAKIAVAGFIAGGLATVDALRRAEFDPIPTTPKPRKLGVARHVALLLAGRW